MRLEYSNKKISGILSVVPDNEVLFEDDIHHYTFSEKQSLRLKKAMGFNKTYRAQEGVTSSDLCISGLNYLFDNELLKKEDIDALLLVTQTPDYILPPTSNVIQGKLGLKRDMLCLDINQGCAGFIVGLQQAFALLDQPNIDKVVLLNADVLSAKVSKADRNSNPLIGDAATITILENSEVDNNISISLKMDGAGAFALQVPAGGARLPHSMSTAELIEDESGNIRSKDHLVMQGDQVFNFVMNEVPPMIEESLVNNSISKEDIDFFMFHQPNKFMLNKLADKIGVPREKMPSNIVENFGNSSGATIPMAICHNLGKLAEDDAFQICMSGFGVGLTWASVVMKIENLNFCKIIYS